MHWNALSQQLAIDFPRCPEQFLTWDHRRPLILDELTRYDPDVMCIAECDSYETTMLPFFSERGYVGIYKKKTGWHRDGIVVFYKTARLKLRKYEIVDF
jgi:mRNA deadenylase 3'-5' endonuclease subunit Ccr4